jgi:hypothetical protein
MTGQETAEPEADARETGARETGAPETGVRETGAPETGVRETAARETAARRESGSRAEVRGSGRRGRARTWWRRPWVVPLALLTVAFLAFSLPPYLTFDPGQSRLPLRDGFGLHYPALVAHILFGTVALVTCCLQVWPWFRGRFPKVHRFVGRTYVFGGVLPAGLMALVVAPTSLQGVSGRVGNTLLAVVWLAFTITGWRMARRRRYVEHRRWMLRSFALTLSIVLNRFWLVLWFVVLTPLVPTYYGGDQAAMIQAAAETSIWCSWVVNLVIVECWLERGRTRRRHVIKTSHDDPASQLAS